VHTARTPAHGADVPRPAHHQRRQSPPARGPAGLDAHLPPDEELLAGLGDAIDDRIAEIVDELIEERNSPRQHRPGRDALASPCWAGTTLQRCVRCRSDHALVGH
jgi:hypothetical protein